RDRHGAGVSIIYGAGGWIARRARPRSTSRLPSSWPIRAGNSASRPTSCWDCPDRRAEGPLSCPGGPAHLAQVTFALPLLAAAHPGAVGDQADRCQPHGCAGEGVILVGRGPL